VAKGQSSSVPLCLVFVELGQLTTKLAGGQVMSEQLPLVRHASHCRLRSAKTTRLKHELGQLADRFADEFAYRQILRTASFGPAVVGM
jgi:hypothetical protein